MRSETQCTHARGSPGARRVVWWVPDGGVGVPGPSMEDVHVQTPDWKPRGWWWLVSGLVALDILLGRLAPAGRDWVLWWLGASVVRLWIRERGRRATAPHRPVSANHSLAIIGCSEPAAPPIACESRTTGCCEHHNSDVEDRNPPASPSGSSESWATAGPATPPPTVSCVVSPEDRSLPPLRAPASPTHRSESAPEERQSSFLCPPFPCPPGPGSPRPPRLPSTPSPGSDATVPLASIPQPLHLPSTLTPTLRGRPPRLPPQQRAPVEPIPPSADSTPTTHALDRFVRMRRMGLPVEAVAHALVREAIVHDLASALEFAEQMLSPEHAPKAVVDLPRACPSPVPRVPVIRRLHWHTLSAEEVDRRSAHSVWRRVPSSLPPTVDRAALRADLARLFSSASSVPTSALPSRALGSTAPALPAASSCSPTSIASSQDAALDGTKQHRSTTPSSSVPAASLPLDSRALLRCGIAFRRLEREGGALRCVRAVRDGARDRISDAALVIFGSSIPRFTPETHSALQAISTSTEPLASFVLAVAHCPRFFPRADAMLTLASAAEVADGLLTDSNALHRASEWVCQSEALARLLSTVLSIGNLLNGTESSVAAFAVSRMTRLESVRGTSTTFLDYCAQRCVAHRHMCCWVLRCLRATVPARFSPTLSQLALPRLPMWRARPQVPGVGAGPCERTEGGAAHCGCNDYSGRSVDERVPHVRFELVAGVCRTGGS